MLDTKLRMIATILVLIGALNWGLVAMNQNIVDLLPNRTLKRVVYAVIGLSALLLALNRNTYLPFLGQTAFPCGLLKTSIPEGELVQAVVDTKPNTMIVYWASESGEKKDNPWDAYMGYKNSGVVMSDANGKAVLSVRPPSEYSVKWKDLKRHIHYRECVKNGLLGEVKTVFI